MAYVDPGNFATNLQAGAQHGLSLAWVVVAACGAAAVVQLICARLGAVAGAGLAEVIAANSPPWVRRLTWLQAEAAVVMTDLAEIVGGALGLRLLFGVPTPVGAMLVGGVGFGVMSLRGPSRAAFRAVVLGLLGVVFAAVLVMAWQVNTAPPHQLIAALVPRALAGDQQLLATAIVGATIMPHALYFHSALCTQHLAGPPARRRRRSRLAPPVLLAMTMAAIVSLSLLVGAAALPPAGGDTIDAAHAALADSAGPLTATLLGIALTASGLSSTLVGVYTGQVVTAGLLRFRISDVNRRLLALAPPVLVLAAGLDPIMAIVASQAELAVALPVTLVPLIIAGRSRRVMGEARIGAPTAILAWATAGAVTALDVRLLLGLLGPS